MKRFNVVKPENYTTKDGEEKTKWHRVGEIVLFDNGGLCKIYALGDEFKVFEYQDRDSTAQQKAQEPDISLDEIPY